MWTQLFLHPCGQTYKICFVVCRCGHLSVLKHLQQSSPDSPRVLWLKQYSSLPRRDVVGNENPNFSIECHALEFICSEVLLVLDNDSIFDNFPTSRIEGNYVPHHLILPIWVVFPIECGDGFH